MKRLAPLALGATLLAASGCVSGTINRYSTDRVNFVDVPLAQTQMSNDHCDLRLCFVGTPSKNGGPRALQRIILQHLLPHFASVKLQPAFPPKDCDLGLKFDNYMNGDKAVLYSAHTGEFLARYQTVFTRMGALVCSTVKDGSPLFDKIPGAAAVAYRAAKPAAPQVAGAAPQPAAPAPSAPAAAPASPLPRYAAPERPDDLAVILGVETYSEIAAKAPYAERDADAVKAHIRALGVPERNIVLLKGPKAGKAALEKNLEVWLARLAKPESRVYFYFSGHGAPDIKTGQAYLVPWDGDPNFLEATAYPVSRLYQKLGALPARQVLVAMDSCFSGAGGRSVLASGARPLVAKVETGEVPAKLTVLAASAASEISGSLDDRAHGAFTYFLLEGLNAGKTGAKALHAYLTPKVQDEARRLNRDQTPQFLGADLTLR